MYEIKNLLNLFNVKCLLSFCTIRNIVNVPIQCSTRTSSMGKKSISQIGNFIFDAWFSTMPATQLLLRKCFSSESPHWAARLLIKVLSYLEPLLSTKKSSQKSIAPKSTQKINLLKRVLDKINVLIKVVKN